MEIERVSASQDLLSLLCGLPYGRVQRIGLFRGVKVSS